MNINQSLISKRDSTLVKGLLILLIILGHNSILMQERSVFDYLYHFHVYIFLLLPFLYNVPEFTSERVKKDFVHIYKPYTIMFIVVLMINIFALNGKVNVTGVIYSYISGNEQMIKKNIGASFLWFMPTMYSLLLLRNWLMEKPAKILWSCLFVSFLSFLATRVFWFCTVYDFPYIILGGTVSLVYFFMAVSSRYVYEKYHGKRFFDTISCTLFILTTIISFTSPNGYLYNIITWGILPVSALYTFIAIARLFKKDNTFTKCIHWLGKESLPIYLFHVVIYNAILLVIQKVQLAENLLTGIISYVVTIVITIILIFLCKKSKIYNIIFN